MIIKEEYKTMTDFIVANEEIFIALCGIAFLGFVIWMSWASRRDNAKSKDATNMG